MGTKPIAAVENLVQILTCLSFPDAQVGVRELSRRIGLRVPTVHRLLQCMEQQELVVQKPDTQRYVLGPLMIQLGAAALNQLDVRRVALPHMKRLRDRVQETVTLSIPYGADRVPIEQVLSLRDPTISIHLGARHPLVQGSVGKVLLAFMPDSKAQAVAGNKWSEVEPQLQGIRVNGYSASYEELSVTVAAVSAPIFNRLGECVAAMAIVTSVSRLPQSVLPAFAADLISTSQAVSMELGYSSIGTK